MSNAFAGNWLCRIGCIALGLITGGLAWFLLQAVLDFMALFLLCLFVFVATAWMLHEALCKRSREATKRAPLSGTEYPAVEVAAVSAVAREGKKAESDASDAKPKASKTKAANKRTSVKANASSKAKKSADGPQLFTKKPAQIDNLKLISGVGSKLESVLNDLGIYQYSQIAGWKKKDIAYVDERLKFRGRIERDDWVKQAKTLVKGGKAGKQA